MLNMLRKSQMLCSAFSFFLPDFYTQLGSVYFEVVVDDEATEGARESSFSHEQDECSFPNLGQSAPVFS